MTVEQGAEGPPPADPPNVTNLALTSDLEEELLTDPTAVTTPPDTDTGLTKTERIVRMIGVLGVAVSAALAVWQYIDQNIEVRKERSIALMTQWQESDARDAYARLAAKVEGAVTAVGPLPENLDAEGVRLAKKGIGASLIASLSADPTEVQWEVDVQRLVDFYSEVEFCVSSGLCHRPLIADYFGADVVSFWDYFGAYADQRRANFYPTFGGGVDRLVALVSDG